MHTLRLSIIIMTAVVSHIWGISEANAADNGMIMSTRAVRLMQNNKPAEALTLLQAGAKKYAAKNDTLNKEFINNFLVPQFECYFAMKNFQEAANIGHRITLINKKITLRSEIRPDHTEQLSKAATENSQDRKEEKDTLYKNKTLQYAMFIACALLVIYSITVTVFLVIHLIRDRRKDKARMQIIERMQRYKRLLYEISLGKIKDPVHGEKALEELLEQSDINEDERTFWKMMNIIIKKKMYLNPELSREDVTQEIYVPKNKFGNMFKTYAGTTFKAYINSLRIDEAMNLMKQYPDYTIETIAQECGMASVQTFYRIFGENTGMTPAEYRANLLDKNKDEELPPRTKSTERGRRIKPWLPKI